MGLSLLAFSLRQRYLRRHAVTVQHSALRPYWSSFSWDLAAHHKLEPRESTAATAEPTASAQASMQHQLVFSWSQSYKNNIAAFACSSRYLHLFLLNKALIFHGVKFSTHLGIPIQTSPPLIHNRKGQSAALPSVCSRGKEGGRPPEFPTFPG